MVVGGLAGCGQGPVSNSPDPVGPTHPVACLDLSSADCRTVADATAVSFARDVVISAMVVQGFACVGGLQDCPDTLQARPAGSPLVETLDGRLWTVAVSIAGGQIVLGDPVEALSARVAPTSGRAGAAEIPFSLGHCGLYSPIDVDGSFWDPVGPIDGQHPAAINASDGRLRFTGPASAEFRTADGFVLALARRAGPKSYQLCD
jgi:hypothetical protein